MKKRDDDANLSCSFCGKSQREVKKLIAGPTVYICDECIELCNDIIAEEYSQEEQATTTSLVPKPVDIKEALDDYVIGQDEAKKVLAVAVSTLMGISYRGFSRPNAASRTVAVFPRTSSSVGLTM